MEGYTGYVLTYKGKLTQGTVFTNNLSVVQVIDNLVNTYGFPREDYGIVRVQVGVAPRDTSWDLIERD